MAGCVIAAVVVCTNLSFGQAGATTEGNAASQASHYVPVLHFISTRDAGEDIRAALAEAERTGKRVLVDVGGDWCSYCQQMDLFFQKNPELLRIRNDGFITVKVFYGKGNKNEKALSVYPKLEGIPHIFVLGPDGTVLHSQHMLELRSQGAYDVEKMRQFLLKWGPHVDAEGTAAASPTDRRSPSKPESEGPR